MPSFSDQGGFTVSHQRVSLAVDFEAQELRGFTVLTLEADPAFSERISLDCSDQCEVQMVLVADKPASVQHRASFRVGPEDKDPGEILDKYNEHVRQHDQDGLMISVPEELKVQIRTMQSVTVVVHYAIHRPVAGLFFVPSLSGKDSYLYSQNQTHSTRHWLPCLDTVASRCTWEFELRVPVECVVVACGELADQVLLDDGTKVCTFKLAVAASAQAIGLAAGPFEAVQDASDEKLFYFCPPELVEELDNSVSVMPKAHETFCEYLQSTLPFKTYKQVFVPRCSGTKAASCASLAIFSADLLHDESVIDQTFSTRITLVETLAEQWFGVQIFAKGASDVWLTVGLARYLAMQFFKKHFGQNDVLFRLRMDSDWVCEQDVEQLPLSNSISEPDETRIEFVRKKGFLVVYTFERWLGKNELVKMLTKILTSFESGETTQGLSQGWFSRTLKKQSTRDKEVKAIMDHYVFRPGCPVFKCNYLHNRKKNVVELQITQSSTSRILPKYRAGKDDKEKGEAVVYMGSITIRVVEIEGSFDHVVNLEEPQHRFEFPIRSRNRRAKKKDEMDVALGSSAADDVEDEHSHETLHWLRLDPEDEWILSKVQVNQNEASWRRQLQLDKDVLSQLQSIRGLRQRQSKQTVLVLLATMTDPRVFYRVQMEAALAIAASSSYVNDYLGLTYLQQYFTFKYCLGGVSKNSIVHLAPGEDPAAKNGAVLPSFITRLYDEEKTGPPLVGVPKPHDFSKFTDYFVGRALIAGVALSRDENSLPIPAVMKFLVALLRYHDNGENPYSDADYLSDVILTLGKCLLPPDLVTFQENGRASKKAASVIYFFDEALEEVYRYLEIDSRSPSFHDLVTAACLEVLLSLQIAQVIPFDLQLFVEYSQPRFHGNARRIALRALVKFGLGDAHVFRYLLHLLAADPSQDMRAHVAKLLAEVFSSISENAAAHEQLESLLRSIQALPSQGGLSIDDAIIAQMNRVACERRTHLQMMDIYMNLVMLRAGAIGGSKPKLSIKFSGSRGKRRADDMETSPPPEAQQQKQQQQQQQQQQPTLKKIRLRAPETPDQDAVVDVEDEPAQVVLPAQAAEEERDQMQEIVDRLWSKPDALAFKQPVQALSESYHAIITNATDLTIIKNKVKKGAYATKAEFDAELNLMFENCFYFNSPFDLVYQRAKELKFFVDKEYYGASGDFVAPVAPTPAALAEKVKIQEATLMDETDFRAALHAWEQLTAQPQAVHFLVKVDTREVPLYAKVITSPMDFDTMQRKLTAGEYLYLRDFEVDVRLIVANCLYFNAAWAPFAKDAQALEAFFDSIWPPARSTVTADEESASEMNLQEVAFNREVGRWRRVVDGLIKHPNSVPFRSPLDKKLFGAYYRHVSKPMWLRTIAQNLAPPEVKYREAHEVEADVRLMFANCYYYNAAWEEVAVKARALEAAFNQAWGSGPTVVPSPKAPSPSNLHDRCFSAGARAPLQENGTLAALDVAPADGGTPAPLLQPMDDTLRTHCVLFLRALQRHPQAGYFVNAVPPSTPNYGKLIPHPMHLGLVDLKLQNREYATLLDFEVDLRLIIADCTFYNKPWSEVHKAAQQLEEFMDRHWPPSEKEIEQPKPAESQLLAPSASSAQLGGGQDWALYLRVVDNLLASPDSVPFRMPLKKTNNQIYFDVVKEPIDLQAVRKKVEGRKYKSAEDFEYDLRLLFYNAKYFNAPWTEYYKMTLRLEALFERSMYDNVVEVKNPQQPTAAALRLGLWQQASRLMDESSWQRCRAIIADCLGADRARNPFWEVPSRASLAGYYDIIVEPMSLAIVLARLDNREYRMLYDFEMDVRLIFENCKFFNAFWTSFAAAARRLEDTFKEEWERVTGLPGPFADFSNVPPVEAPAAPLDRRKRGRKKRDATTSVSVKAEHDDDDLDVEDLQDREDTPTSGSVPATGTVVAPAPAPVLKLKLTTQPAPTPVAILQESRGSDGAGFPVVEEAGEDAEDAEGRKKKKKKKDKDRERDPENAGEGAEDGDEVRKKKKKKKDKRRHEEEGAEDGHSQSEGEGQAEQPAVPSAQPEEGEGVTAQAAAPAPAPKLKLVFSLKGAT